MDSGLVGVIDLSNNTVTKMETKHESVRDATSDLSSLRTNHFDQVCGTVKFVPDRPRELVSGGYDTTLLHFDFVQGKVLSRLRMGEYFQCLPIEALY